MSSVELISDDGLRHLMEAVCKIDPNDKLYQLVRVKFNSIRLFREGLKDVDDVKAFKYETNSISLRSDAAISDDDVDLLRSIYSFINNQQNLWGRSDVFGQTPYNVMTSIQYEGYMMMCHDKDNIVEYDTDIAVLNGSPLRNVNTQPPNTTTTSTNSTTNTGTYNKTKSSSTGIKRSIDTFKEFTNILQWKDWFREFVNLVAMMDAKNALDPTYTPSNDAEREKFEDDKTFISTVLGRVMKEAAGEDILRDNVDDTTVTWPLIVKTYTMGPKASVQARKFHKILATAAIPEDPKAQGGIPLETRLEQFVEMRRLYNSCSITPMSEDNFKVHLERFTMQVRELRQVTTTLSLDYAKTNVMPSLHDVIELYKNQAIMIDEMNGMSKKKIPSSSSRLPFSGNNDLASLNINELTTMSEDEGLSDEALIYDIYRARMDPSSMLPSNVYRDLPVEDKKAWLRMSPEGRTTIVQWGTDGKPTSAGTPGYPNTPTSSRPSSGSSSSRPSPSRPYQRRVNIADQEPSVIDETEPVDTTPPSDNVGRSLNALTIMSSIRTPISRNELSANGREDLIQRSLNSDGASPGNPSRLLAFDNVDISREETLTSKDGEDMERLEKRLSDLERSVEMDNEERERRLNALRESQVKNPDDGRTNSSAFKRLLNLSSRRSGKPEPTDVYKLYMSIRPSGNEDDPHTDPRMHEADQVLNRLRSDAGTNQGALYKGILHNVLHQDSQTKAGISSEDGETKDNADDTGTTGKYGEKKNNMTMSKESLPITINGTVVMGFQGRKQPSITGASYHENEGMNKLDHFNQAMHGAGIGRGYDGYGDTYQRNQSYQQLYRPYQCEAANNGMCGIIDGGSNQTHCGFSFQEMGENSWTDRYVRADILGGVREDMRIGTQFAITIVSNPDGSNVREAKVVVHEGACAPGSPHYKGNIEVKGSIGGESILSMLQMQDQGLVTDTSPRGEGGYQCVYVPDSNVIIPLSIRDGISYMPLRPASDEDIMKIDEVIILTSGRHPWDPGVYDSEANYDDNANGADDQDNGNDSDSPENYTEDHEMTDFSFRMMRITYRHFGPESHYERLWGDNMITPPLMRSGTLRHWVHFVQLYEKSYVQVNCLAEYLRLETIRISQNKISKNAKRDLNMRLRLNAAVHDKIRALTVILDTPWKTPNWTTRSDGLLPIRNTDAYHPHELIHGLMENDYTIIMHPHLITYLETYNYTTRDVIEGLMFGDEKYFYQISTTDMISTPSTDYDYRRNYNEIRPGIKGPRDTIADKSPNGDKMFK